MAHKMHDWILPDNMNIIDHTIITISFVVVDEILQHLMHCCSLMSLMVVAAIFDGFPPGITDTICHPIPRKINNNKIN